ncbi:1984_t:CDS:1, partial [Paraglomus occultum]
KISFIDRTSSHYAIETSKMVESISTPSEVEEQANPETNQRQQLRKEHYEPSPSFPIQHKTSSYKKP